MTGDVMAPATDLRTVTFTCPSCEQATAFGDSIRIRCVCLEHVHFDICFPCALEHRLLHPAVVAEVLLCTLELLLAGAEEGTFRPEHVIPCPTRRTP
jgi:hypothetical protein